MYIHIHTHIMYMCIYIYIYIYTYVYIYIMLVIQQALRPSALRSCSVKKRYPFSKIRTSANSYGRPARRLRSSRLSELVAHADFHTYT